MAERIIKLQRYEWTLGERLGGGGFGDVFEATSPDVDTQAVAKLVPKAPGAERELLFVNPEARNVVPVLDAGEVDDSYVLVMERAEKSLRAHLNEHGELTEEEAVAVLKDIATTLQDLDGKVVHRDLKPDNVLLLNGHWCLADFGIARYAEASTSENTRKFAKTPGYAAPEQWREERATAATDIYAMGVMAYEMLVSALPFPGPDFREQHLHEVPPALEGISGRLSSLVNQCLNKHQASRPSAADVRRRLESVGGPPVRPGLARLQEAHEQEVMSRAEAQSVASQAESEKERHARLFEDARRDLGLIASEVESALVDAAPSIIRGVGGGALWMLQLGTAVLRLSDARPQYPNPYGMPFEVHGYAAMTLEAPGQYGYRGRSHSLWYCDSDEENRFSWYELAFVPNSFAGGGPSPIAPFALTPDEGARAITPGVDVIQLARSLKRLEPGELDEFIERWGNWLATARSGDWSLPNLPDEPVIKAWRAR